MDQADGSNALIQQNVNTPQSLDSHTAGDQNRVDGTVQNGGIVIQGNQVQVQIEQHFDRETSSPDLESPDAAEIIKVQYFEPETVLIPEGSFFMGSSPGKGIPEYETPQHEVHLGVYRIGKRPVTNAQYKLFVDQTGKLVPRIMGWKGQLVPEGHEDDPVMGVTWDEAMAYCKWLSTATSRHYSLPNEAQWEKSLRGTYGLAELFENVLQWTCTLWGAKRAAPDAKYRYPWKDDGRNTQDPSNLMRVVRGVATSDDIGSRKFTMRRGQDPQDPGFPDFRHSFRVALIF